MKASHDKENTVTTTSYRGRQVRVTHTIYSVRTDGSLLAQGHCVKATDEQAFDRAVQFSSDNPSLTVIVKKR